jgi:hypothetical protein
MRSITASALLVSMFFFACLPTEAQQTAENEKYAPLPDKVIKAKTVFYVNDTGNSRFGDDLYRELRKWNRWQVVADRSKADLVLVLSQRETVGGVIATGTAASTGNVATGTAVAAPIKSSSWFIHLIDPSSGETLWTTRHTLGDRLWQSWGSVARSLLSDMQKRMKRER